MQIHHLVNSDKNAQMIKQLCWPNFLSETQFTESYLSINLFISNSSQCIHTNVSSNFK